MNEKFQNALKGIKQECPPIWFMRQAGRYHQHYQKLRRQHSFETLCREPELAAQVALGPVEEFDFDVSILFSDLLFPLDAMGMGLSYSDAGPALQKSLATGFKLDSGLMREAPEKLNFQADALLLTRELLPKNKSLIGFVGGVWTLFVYATEGGHSGNMTTSKKLWPRQNDFIQQLNLLLEKNIQSQLKAGAEVVMIFDTSAGELSPACYQQWVEPYLVAMAEKFPNRLGYYSRNTQQSFFSSKLLQAPWAGRGIDHRWNLPNELKLRKKGFIQGNFDQALLFQDTDDFVKSVLQYLQTFKALSVEERTGWVSGLGHGVLPKTPEEHVHRFIQLVREEF